MKRSSSASKRHGPRAVLSVIGPEGHGKTALMLTAPQPMVIASVDPNTQDVIEKTFGKPVDEISTDILTFHEIPFPAVGFEEDEDAIKEQAAEGIEKLIDVVRSISGSSTRSVLLDTGTELNELNILEAFGRTDKISPMQRQIYMGKVNARFKGIFRQLKRENVHVLVSHRSKEVWETVTVKHGRNKGEEKDVKVPGKYERIGFKQMGNIVNTEVLVKFDPTREGKLAAKFGMEITRCMIRPGLIGKEYWGRVKIDDEMVRRASFPFLMMQLYPGTTLENWR